jgi:hypothetical protein
MTKLTVETDNNWTKNKIKDAIHTETELLRTALQRTQVKSQDFENKYGKFDRNSFYGKVDDLVLVEWEGELETMKRLQEKLKSLEDITFEYK